MSEKDRLIQARQAMRAGKMQQARVLLSQINHPKAKEWLSLLPDTSVSPGWSRNGIAVVTVAAVLLLILAGMGGFLAGREAMRQEIAVTFAAVFAPASGATAGAMDSTPVPVGGVIATPLYSVRVMAVERPTTLRVSDTFGGDYEPAAGANLAAVQIEFTCPTTEVTCYTFSAEPEVLLKDGRIVYPLSQTTAYIAAAGDDKMIGGASLTLWRVYEVPAGAVMDALMIENKRALLPAS